MSRMLFLLLSCIAFAIGASDWPSYRGPGASGVGDGAPPTSWNADPAAGPPRNILWKTPIPGLSHSSPIVWNNHVFVTTAISAKGDAPLKIGLYGAGDSADDTAEQSWVLYCFDKRTGKEVWKQTAHSGAPKVKRHTKATHDNTTLATDGKRLIAFLGSEGLYAYSLDGKLLWQKDLGIMDMTPFDDRTLSWGFASSPALFEDTILVQNDSKKDSFAAAFDARDGRELWRVPRKDVSVGSWGSPAVIRAANRTQVVLNGYPWIVSYDFKTGKEFWRMRSGGDVPVPTPFYADGLIYVANAHGRKAPLYAIRPDATGDISLADGATTSAGIVWAQERNGSYLQTPIVYEGIAYASTSQGVFKAYDAKTGEKFYENRLGSGATGFTSSPVAAGGHIYVTSEEGETYVLKHSRSFQQVAKNQLGETVLSTPAISAGVLFFHTRGHLLAVTKN